jgi:hypothetical protein
LILFGIICNNTAFNCIFYYVFDDSTYVFFGRTGVRSQGFVLTRQMLYYLSHTFRLFLLWSFLRWGLMFFTWTNLVRDPPIYISHVAGMTGTHHHAWLID